MKAAVTGGDGIGIVLLAKQMRTSQMQFQIPIKRNVVQ